MKKVFYLLLGILLILPSVAKADMSSPEVIQYKATVNNPDGIDEYKYDYDNDGYVKTGKKIPYGSTYTVYSDEFICIDNECESFVNPKDLTPIEKEYKLKDDELNKESISATALKDIEIKKGPAVAYGGTGVTIKAGTKFNMHEIFTGKSETPWYYVEYNGTKGYVDTYDDGIAYNIRENEFITGNKIEILDPVTKKSIKTIDVYTKIKANIGTLSYWSKYGYIEYNGTKGLFDIYSVIEKNEAIEITAVKETDLYSDLGAATKIGTIPVGTTFTSEYYDYTYESIIYYEKDGVKGFAISDYENWKFGDEEELETPTEEEKEEELETPTEEEKEEPKKEEGNEIIKAPKPKKDYTLYICIGAGILLSITAIVIVLLINKKKKQKEL